MGSACKTPIIAVRDDKEVRCPNCFKLLLKGELAAGSRIQIKCERPRCRTLVNIERM